MNEGMNEWMNEWMTNKEIDEPLMSKSTKRKMIDDNVNDNWIHSRRFPKWTKGNKRDEKRKPYAMKFVVH